MCCLLKHLVFEPNEKYLKKYLNSKIKTGILFKHYCMSICYNTVFVTLCELATVTQKYIIMCVEFAAVVLHTLAMPVRTWPISVAIELCAPFHSSN